LMLRRAKYRKARFSDRLLFGYTCEGVVGEKTSSSELVISGQTSLT